jgi:HSP20 family protein
MAATARNEITVPQTRRDPMTEIQRLFGQLSRFPDSWTELPAVMEGFTPLADVEETDDGYVIELELPGVTKKDVDIAISERRLTVTGERKEKERKGILRRQTRAVGRFQFDVQLPGPIDDNAVVATMEDGVLTIRVPKSKGDRPHHIEVK